MTFFFFYREAPQSCGVEKRRDQRNCANFFDPASSQHHNSGGLHGKKKKKAALSQLRALATRTPSLGRVGQAAWELGFAQIGGAIFLGTLACLDISSKKGCL